MTDTIEQDAAAAEIDAANDRVETERMLTHWRHSLLAAERAATDCQAAGDHVARWLGTLQFNLAVACTDPGEWFEAERPESGVQAGHIQATLRDAMAGLYAKAGAYRRAAGELNRAILGTLSPADEAAEVRAAADPDDDYFPAA